MKISPAQVQLKHPSITQNFSTEPSDHFFLTLTH